VADTRSQVREWVAYLAEMGVPELTAQHAPEPRRPAAQPESKPAQQPAKPPEAARDGHTPSQHAAGLELIRGELGECKRCKLHAGRKNIVFGVGAPAADLMFIGEGPGADEDERGEPFVGRAGRKLDDMIASIGLERSQVYIANVVKCRPPRNRDPEPDEIETCSPFLLRQIEAVRPRVIVTLGSPATKTLLQTTTGITKLRGNWHEFRGIPVMPTFHPAYLLRAYTKENRLRVWNDLKAARQRMEDGT